MIGLPTSKMSSPEKQKDENSFQQKEIYEIWHINACDLDPEPGEKQFFSSTFAIMIMRSIYEV